MTRSKEIKQILKQKFGKDVGSCIFPIMSQFELERKQNLLNLKQSALMVLSRPENPNYAVVIHQFNPPSTKAHMLTIRISDDGEIHIVSGQWLGGKKVVNADLSPDGTMLIYGLKLRKPEDRDMFRCLTVISKPPYFTGLAVYETANVFWNVTDLKTTGGVWLSDGKFMTLNNNSRSTLEHPVVSGLQSQTPTFLETRKEVYVKHFSGLSCDTLRQELRQRVLKVSGNKKVLVERLAEFDSQRDWKSARDDDYPARHAKHLLSTSSCTVANVPLYSNTKFVIGQTSFFIRDGFIGTVQQPRLFDLADEKFRAIAPPEDYTTGSASNIKE